MVGARRQPDALPRPDGAAVAYYSHGESHVGILLVNAGALRVFQWQLALGWEESGAVRSDESGEIVDVAASSYGSANKSGRHAVEVFAISHGGRLISSFWTADGEPGPWVIREAGREHRGVAAARAGASRIDVYAIAEGKIARYRLESRRWTTLPSIALPAEAGNPLIVTAQERGSQYELFVLTDRLLLQRSFGARDGGRNQWKKRQLPTAGRGLAVSSLARDHLEVFVHDGETIWHQWYHSAADWSSWHEFRPQAGGDPLGIAAGSRYKGHQDLFVLSTDGGLWGTGYEDPDGWAEWAELVKPTRMAAPAPGELIDRLRLAAASQEKPAPAQVRAPDRDRSAPDTVTVRPPTSQLDVQSPLTLFISYHRPDEVTFGMVGFLRQQVPARFASFTGRRLEVFVDVEAPGGIEWERNIRHKARECDFFLPMLTTAYFWSVNCRNEVGWFLESRDEVDQRLSIIPVNLIPQNVLKRYCPKDARTLLDSLAVFNWIDASSGETGPVLQHLVDRTLVPFMDALPRRA